MTSLTEQLRTQAAECEQKARAVADPEVRRTYIDLAAQWRELCGVIEKLDREQPPSSENLKREVAGRGDSQVSQEH